MSIKQIHIVDDQTGALLADVDASSVADGLAYYLRSRKIQDISGVALAFKVEDPDDAILFEQRDSITGALEVALFAYEADKSDQVIDAEVVERGAVA